MSRKIYYFVFLVLYIKGTKCSPIVQTANGLVQGEAVVFMNRKINQFLGIPFAKPPVGKLRFKAPEPTDNWNGIYNATKQPDSCFQEKKPYIGSISEDCLYLNIWAPSDPACKSLKPVMVWIYGGAFREGTVNLPIYKGQVLAAHGDVVLSAMNYRLGVFGFLNAYSNDAPGNMGILDQNLALRWIWSNIKAFGGDPNQITIFGESAGSMSVHVHLMSSLSRGLFKRAIMQSGTQYSPDQIQSLEISMKKSDLIAKQLRCSDNITDLYSQPAKVVECLRGKSAESLLDALENTFPKVVAPLYPSYGSNILRINSIIASRRGLFHNGELLIGSNSDEGSLFLSEIVDDKYLQPSLDDFTEDEILKVFTAAVEFRASEQFSSHFGFYLRRPEYQGKKGIRKAASDFLGDLRFVCPSVFLSERYSDRDNRVFHYEFSHRSALEKKPAWFGVQHADEVQYVFGYPVLSPSTFTDEDKNLSLKMVSAWANFAKTGNPSGTDFSWPSFTRSTEQYVNLKNGEFASEKLRRKEFCDFWRNLVEA